MDFNEALAKYTEKHLAAGGDSSPQSLDALYFTCLGIYEREGMDALESFVNQDFKLRKQTKIRVGYSYYSVEENHGT